MPSFQMIRSDAPRGGAGELYTGLARTRKRGASFAEPPIMERVLKVSQRCSGPPTPAQRKTPPNDCPAGAVRGARLLAITLGRCAARDPLNGLSRSRDGSHKSRGQGSTCDICMDSHYAISFRLRGG